MTDPATQMQQLANTLAQSSDGLDFSLASLATLETLAKRKPRTAAHTLACGAYLGETLCRQAPELEWVSLETASKANAVIAKMTPGPDLVALLQAGSAYWFPLSKVEKFQANGTQDSLTPFANVLLASLPSRQFTPEQDAAEQRRLHEAAARVRGAKEAFDAAPTKETMVALEGALFGNVARRDMPETFARLGFEASAWMPFLGTPAEGRGLKRIEYGAAAAAMLKQLIALGGVPRDPALEALREVLKGPSKDVRYYAASVLAYCDLTEGNTEVLLTLTGSRDRNIAGGALSGLRSVTADWHMRYATPKIAMAPLAPMLRTMLAPKSPHLEAALGIARTWTPERTNRHELALIADALLPLLDHKKPMVAKQATGIVHTYLLAILHGHAPRDAALEAKLSKRKDGVGGPTLEKIRAM